MVFSVPEMSQLLYSAIRLFLLLCHSVIQESNRDPLPKETDIFLLLPPALPKPGG